jgi:DNA-binding SARP family transcriptional activator/predicted ATPase
VSRLHLALLGTPEVVHDERVLTFSTRKVLALLVYLVVEKGLHSREKLTALLWPESEAREGGATLRSTIARLRAALEDVPNHSHLIVERDVLSCDFASDVNLDLDTLGTAFKRCQGSTNVDDLHGETRRILLIQLQAAVDRYRGGFPEGFHISDAPDFEDWARMQREIWHRRMSVVFDCLSQVQFDGGELSSAIDTTTRWIAHEPLNETAHLRIMQVYFTAGDRKAALQAYENYRSMLAKEWRARPAPEISALAERIRTQMPAPGVHIRPERREDGEPRPPALPNIPLTGRAEEYGKLIDLYHAVQDGQTHVVILKGEAGIGKTRLASDFLGWASAHGADVLSGRAFETRGRLPYQPLVEALHSCIEHENAPDDLLSDAWLAELSRVLPDLRERYPDLPPPSTDETTARIRLFEAIGRLGQALAERTPVVLFIDDVHRADAASLDALHYAGQRWRESKTPLLLLLSTRAEALVTMKDVARWLSDLERELHATLLALDALAMEETLQLVRAIGADPTQTSYLEGFGRWLFSETRGQPFYIIETLKALLERGLLPLRQQANGRWVIDFAAAVDSGAWIANAAGLFTPTSKVLPHGVRAVIRARLEQVTPNAFALLAAGAVLGHDFTFEHLCQVTAIGENDGLPALDEVLMHRLLAEGNGRGQAFAGTYVFTHDKIRDVVYTEAGEARRRIFHRHALEALQGTVAPAAELARHAIAAGVSEAAFRWSVAAGDDAMRLFAVRDAIPHYEQARSLIAELQGRSALPAGFSLSAIQHLYVQLGRAYELITDTGQARLVYEELLILARESGSSTLEQAALNHLVTITAQNPYELKQAAVLLEQTLQVAGHKGEDDQTPPTIEEAETEWNQAQVAVYAFDPHSALLHGERALAIARQLGQQELVARSLNVLGYALMVADRWEEAERSLEEAAMLFQALGNRAMEVDSLSQAASCKINNGRPHAAISEARTAHTISIEIENAWGQVNSAIPLAQGLLEIGAYAEALSTVQEAVAIAQAHNL